MRFDPVRLAGVPGRVAWSEPSTFADTRVHHGYRRAVVVDFGRLVEPELGWLVEPFNPVYSAWLSWIDPGGFIVAHHDGGPYRERWQVPVVTAGWMDQHGNRSEAVNGVPFRVAQWLRHEVRNQTDRPRVHLVVDRDVLLDVPPQPFHIYKGDA